MTIKEEIEEAIGRDCKVNGVLSLELCRDKLNDLICLLHKSVSIVAGAERELANQRIGLLTDPHFKPNFKSGRELDRNMDEHCAPALQEKIQAELLFKSLESAIRAMTTLVSSLSR